MQTCAITPEAKLQIITEELNPTQLNQMHYKCMYNL